MTADVQGVPLDPSDPAYRGQAVYTTRTLRAYDAVVVKLSNSLVWRCPARDILAQDDRYVSAALSYVLHCLPGALDAKAAAFDNVIRLVAPGGGPE